MPPISSRRPKLTTGLVLMLRHRAANYSSALRHDSSDLVINESRNLLGDLILDSDTVMELTDAWLRQQEARQERVMRGKRSMKKEGV